MSAVIEVTELSFSWHRGGPEVLNVERLTVEQGERLFLQGPSGSGKSTLLNLLGGVVTPRSGSIRVLGRDLGRLGASARDRFRADHVGFVFQLHNLLPYLSVVDNVTLPCRFSRLRRQKALSRSPSLEREALRLLEHLDMAGERGRPVGELSVGQQQRVAAARALIGAPELIIADEPTSSLDADRREAFLRLLTAECTGQGSTLLFVSHDAGLAAGFDRIVALDELNRAAAGEDR